MARISDRMHVFQNGVNFERVILILMLIAHHEEREHADTTFASLDYTALNKNMLASLSGSLIITY